MSVTSYEPLARWLVLGFGNPSHSYCTVLYCYCSPFRSALSLAGFCALLRHLGRLTAGLTEALEAGATTKQVWACRKVWTGLVWA